jgi:MFS family permease
MLQNPVRILRGLPGPVRLLVLGTFVNKAGTFILPYLTLVMRREFRLGETTAGFAVAAYGAGSIVSVLAGGVLTDTLGRRTTLAISLLGGGVLAIGMSLTQSMSAFAVMLVAFGFLSELYRPAASAIVGDVLASSQRAVGFAAMRMAVNLGFAFGMVMGGVIVGWSWRALFVGDGLSTIGYGVLVLLFIKETRKPATDASRAEAAAAPAPWRDPVMLGLLVASFFYSLAFFADFTVFPLTVTVRAGYPTVVFGALIGVNGVLIAIFEMSVVQRLAGFRRLRVASLGALVTGIGMGAIGLWPHWGLYLACVVMWMIGEILTFQMAFVTDWAPPAARGRYVAAYQASWMIAVAVNPLLLMPLHARLGERAFWPIMLALCLVPAAILLRLDAYDQKALLRGHSEPDAVEEPPPTDFPA